MKEETEKPHLWKDRHQEASQLHNKGESGNVYNKVTRSNTKHHKFHVQPPQWSLFLYALKHTNITFIFKGTTQYIKILCYLTKCNTKRWLKKKCTIQSLHHSSIILSIFEMFLSLKNFWIFNPPYLHAQLIPMPKGSGGIPPHILNLVTEQEWVTA